MRAPNDPSFLPGYLVAARVPVIVPDTAAEARFGIIEVVRELGLRSALCVPLFGRGEVIGGLTARTFAPREWTEDDVHFMQAVANIVATAIERAATEEALLHAQRCTVRARGCRTARPSWSWGAAGAASASSWRR